MSQLWKLLGALPVLGFLSLMLILAARHSAETWESPLALALLNTFFLCVIPLGMAYLAARSYAATGALAFLAVGCGLVTLGVSSLYAGWVMPLAGAPNPTVTLHNLGSLLAGATQLMGAHLFLQMLVAGQTPVRTLRYAPVYAGIAGVTSIVALLAFRGWLPVFFDPQGGPSLLRQIVLGSAVGLFAIAGFMFVEIYATVRTEFAYWYGLALGLMTIGLTCVLLQRSVGSAMGWTGRAAQYVGCVYFVFAFWLGQREWRPASAEKAQPRGMFWPYLEHRIAQRVAPIVQANQALQEEVTRRHQAEASLHENQAILAEAEKIALMGSWKWDLIANKVTWSDGMFRLFGEEPAGFDGDVARVVAARVHPDDFPTVQQVNMAVLQDRRPTPLEYRICLPDGTERTVWGEGRLVYDQAGQAVALTGYVQDITARKRAETALEQQRKILQATIDNAHTHMVYLDPDFNFVAVNAAYAQTCRRTPAELIGKNHFHFYPHEENEAIFKHMRETGKTVTFHDKPFMFPDQLERGVTYWDWTLTPVKDETEQVVGLVFSLVETTERKQAEEKLRESEVMLRTIFENSPIALATYDKQGTLIHCNKRASEMLGMDTEAQIGKFSLRQAPSYQYPEVWEKLQRGEEARHEVQFDFSKTAYPTTKTGIAYYDIITTPISEAISHQMGYIMQVVDVTERRLAEERLQQTLVEKENLLRELYHRTRNNMQVILNMLQLQATTIQDRHALAAFRDTENRIRTMALAHQMLYEAQDLSNVNLQQYIADLTNLLVASYSLNAGQIQLTLDLQPITVLVDVAVPCGLILYELLANAFEHAFPNGRAGKVCIQLRRVGADEVLLCVADNGLGIPSDFDLRASSTLGLPIVFFTAEHQLQGSVEFQTDAGVTCCVRFKDALYTPSV